MHKSYNMKEMKMFNKVVLVGNLTKDLEIRYGQSGNAVANTAIAVTRKFTQNGEKKEEVCFVDITFFGRSAEVANQYLRKGSKILVEGRLKFDQWQAQDGGNRSKHSIVVENMQMMDSKQDNQGQQQGGQYQQQNDRGASYGGQQNYQAPQQQQQSYQKQEMPQQNIPEMDIDEDEIPF